MTAILRKDWRRLWPHAALFWVMLAICAWLDPVYSGRIFIDEFKPITFALVLACGSLIVNVIQQEAIPGDSQYWLSRPIARRRLLGSKALFILLCVLIPVALDQVVIYAALGIPLGEHAGALVWRQAFFVAFLVLPAAALGAVTRNIGQSILVTVIVVAVIFGVGMSEIVKFVVPVTMDAFTNSLVRGVMFAAGGAAVLWLQYSRRATLASAAVVCATGVLFMLAIRSRAALTPQPAEVFLKLVPLNQAGPPAPLLSLEVPISFDGVPPGLDITVEDLKIGLGETNRPRPFYLRPFEGTLRREGEGRGWLTVLRAHEVLEEYLWADLRFHAQMTLVLSRPGLTLPAPGKHGIVVPAFGRCVEGLEGSGNAIVCYSPMPRTSLALQLPSGARSWILAANDSLNPLPNPLGFQTLDRYSADAEDLKVVRLVTGTIVERRTASLDFQSVPLAVFVPSRH